ncbi:ribosome-binding factor A [Anaeroplasma bactoclasticum]|jgi:ribosome-binding factor A|uniref:Ribosome-binding factor A n=1 Tax=Anaeroplasma bactoclasticum TaxID=2088 RepID=A0A397S211_9MOLU|nr:30S ribosome-binding factor RbfA [Anaeroplasma bactoclasticum]RIA77997.1 ribosome-binding factor A [Anaeroplasma bactoclasticum]
MGISLARLESNALRELAIILRNDAKNKHLSNVTVTEVRITNDLSYMTVYYTFYQGKEENYQKALEDCKGYLRSALAKKLNARKMPELIFKRDTSLDYGNHINDLIVGIHEHDKEIKEHQASLGIKEEEEK